MTRAIATYLISIVLLTMLIVTFHLYKWPGTNLSLFIGIFVLLIISTILIIRNTNKGKNLLLGALSIVVLIFSTGLLSNYLNVRYSILPFGNKYPSSIKVNNVSEIWYDEVSQNEITAKIKDAVKGVDNQWFTRSFIVIMNEKVAFEKYFNGAKPNNAFNLQSATKSVTSALIGTAIDKGFIKSVDQKLSEFFPELFKNGMNAEKSEITIRHLLTMQAGFSYYDNNQTGLNWTESIIYSPLTFSIGENFCYSNSQSHLLAAIIEKTTETSVEEFARNNLFESIQATIGYWAESPDGINIGYADLYLTPRDMARFGNLYLKEGQQNGVQIISKDWVRASLQDYSFEKDRCIQIPYGNYGFQWWEKKISGLETFSAIGWGGQIIMIIPELDVIIVNVNEPNVSEYNSITNTDISLGYIADIIKIFKNESITSAHNKGYTQ